MGALSAGTIAKRLNEEGYRPPKRREEFGRQGIGDLMRGLGLVTGEDHRPEGRDGALGEDEWWLPELAGELAMPKVTLYNWIRRGWIRAHQERGRQRRWVVWANELEVQRLRRLRSLPAGHHVRRKLWAG